MTGIAPLLGEFIAAWNAGARPRIEEFLERAGPSERDELAAQIQTFVMLAPEPEYDEHAWRELTSEPVVARVAAASLLGEAEPWPTSLPRLRARAGLTVAQVAERLGIARADRAKAARLLERMESGDLDPRRPTRRLLEALGRILGVSAESLDWRGGTTPAAAAPALLWSTEQSEPEHDLQVVAEAIMHPAGEWDEVDRLFLGGR